MEGNNANPNPMVIIRRRQASFAVFVTVITMLMIIGAPCHGTGGVDHQSNSGRTVLRCNLLGGYNR